MEAETGMKHVQAKEYQISSKLWKLEEAIKETPLQISEGA